MSEKYEKYDVVDYLKTTQDKIDYLNAALEEDEECPGLFLKALGDVVRTINGISKTSKETGISREALYNALSDSGNPRFSNLISVLHSVGMDIQIRPRDAA